MSVINWNFKDYVFAFFDLETTGLDLFNSQIISYCFLAGNDEFKTRQGYMLPDCQIEEGASRVNKFTVETKESTGKRYLCHKGESLWVPVASQEEGKKFVVDWLKETKERFQKEGKEVHLVAHNGKKFDFPILRRMCENVGFVLDDCGFWFVDTCEIYGNDLQWEGAVTQTNIYKKLFGGETYSAHDASQDCKALKRIVLSRLSEQDIFNNRSKYPLLNVRTLFEYRMKEEFLHLGEKIFPKKFGWWK